MPELLLELFSEEIPARMQARAAEDLKRLVCDGLKKAGLSFEKAEAFVTPRRLALVVDGLPKKQPDTTVEKKGPRVDAPERAIEGFLKSNGLHSVDQCEVREVRGSKFHFAVIERKGRETDDVVQTVVANAVPEFQWPKSMRWGDTSFRWVRPLHDILVVFDGKPLAFSLAHMERHAQGVDRLERMVRTGGAARGHRFLAPKPFKVRDFADYQAKLRAAKVILDPAERRAEIVRQAKAAVTRAKLELKDDPELLDEVTGLVEWPVVLLGRIDPEFMDLPAEVLTTAMRHHQKYFALLDKDGRLAPRFVVVANMETADKGKAIVAGNERVLRARLADAKFFWDQDRKVSLSSRAPRLGGIVFHAKLGSLDEKIDRVQALAAQLAGYIPGADRDRVRSAARLAKADLVTGMVGEFPELQGVMGRYYALGDGEHVEVANAIAEHYAPRGPNDACPSAPVSVAVALADKIDTLVGFWAIDERPTGSKDPYALRRAALGVIRLVIENKIRVPLFEAFGTANDLYPEAVRVSQHDAGAQGLGAVSQELLNFFLDRLRVLLRNRGERHDLLDAVFAVRRPGGGLEQDLVRLLARVDALKEFLETDDGAHLLVAHQRAANIVRIEEKKDKKSYKSEDIGTDKLIEPDEKLLAQRVFDAERDAEDALAREDFTGAMAALATLRHPVDRFFDRVTVNTEDPALRANRLCLLARIGAALGQVADFSKIEG